MPYKIGLIGFESENSIAPTLFRWLAGLDLKGKPKAKPMTFHGQTIQATTFSIKAIFDQILPQHHKVDTMRWKKPLKLSEAITQKPDLDFLMVFQNYMFYENDLDIPVLYRHHDLWSPITLRNADILAMKNYEMKWFIRSYFPYEYKHFKLKIYSFPFVDYNLFNPDREKFYRFINIGPPTDTFDSSFRDYIWNNMVKPNWEFRDCFEQDDLGHSVDGRDIDRFEYKGLMEQSEFVLDSNNWGTYTSRRAVEALASGAIPVMHIESNRAIRVLKRNHFIEGENCLFFRNTNELRKTADLINNHITDNEIDDMREAGYEMMQRYHTPQVRLDQFLMEVDKLG